MPSTSLAAVLLLATSSINIAFAAVTPSGPGPNDVYREGGQCEAQWAPDTTGDWTSFDIDLMSGSNLDMNQVTRVASGLDGTSTTTTSITFDCPDVTPNGKIYFLQFSQDGADPQWTTRFTIAAADGSTTAPANSTQPGGQAIPWGVGRLVGDDGAQSGSSSASRSATSATASAGPASQTSASLSSSATGDDDESSSAQSSSAQSTSTVTLTQIKSSSSMSRSSSSSSSSSSMSGTAAAARTSAPTSSANAMGCSVAFVSVVMMGVVSFVAF
ncbi:hypothetical protein ACM66B_006324 [Microbotryomycetes sp. NB124-2]